MSRHPHRIVIEPQPRGCYSASYDGEVVVVRSRDPEFDACRVLLARGITGPAETWRPGAARPALRLDIERCAGLTVVETPGVGPRLAKWREFRGIGEEATSPRRRGVVQADFEGGALTLARGRKRPSASAGMNSKCKPPFCGSARRVFD